MKKNQQHDKESNSKLQKDHRVKISCSQFVRCFLIMQAKTMKCAFNAHINAVLKDYLAGKIPKLDKFELPIDYVEHVFAKPDWQITVPLYNSVASYLFGNDDETINILIESALIDYVLFILSKYSDSQKQSAKIAENVLAMIDKYQYQMQILDFNND